MRAKRLRSRKNLKEKNQMYQKENKSQNDSKKAPKKSRKGLKEIISDLKMVSIKSGIDLPFLFLVLTILVIGLIMMYSASYPNAYFLHGEDSAYFIKNQLVFAILGIIGMFAISCIDYNYFHKWAVPILGVSFVLLILVLIMPPINGVHRWIQLGSFSFQASEITKFAIVVSFAHFINLNFHRMQTFKYGILPYLIILGPTIALLALEPHISCSAIVILLAAGMLFIGGVKLRWFGMVIGAIAAALLYLVLFTDKLTYANNRIAGWFDPFSPGWPAWEMEERKNCP